MVKGSELPTKVTLAATDSLYVIDNDGTPVSKNTTAGQVINPNSVYGELSAVGPGTTQTNINQNYKKIDQFDTVSSENGITANLGQNKFTVDEDGVYNISFSLSYTGDAGQIFQVAIHVNNTLVANGVTSRTINSGTDIGNVGTSIVQPLSINDDVELRVKTTLVGNHDFTIQTGNFKISKNV